MRSFLLAATAALAFAATMTFESTTAQAVVCANGVVRADDPDTVDAIAPRMESWKNITLNLHGESVEIDGVGFSSIGRLELLTLLQQRVRAVGVTPRYETQIESLDQFEGYDLIVAADGLNSLVRRSLEREFGASVTHSTNKFAWYGTSKRFAKLSQ